MILEKLVEILNLKIYSKGEKMGAEVSDCYICDLLSFAMSNLEENQIWITVQTNINVVAIADLTDAACVIIPENQTVAPEVLEKAEKEGITLLSSPKTAYELAKEISRAI